MGFPGGSEVKALKDLHCLVWAFSSCSKHGLLSLQQARVTLHLRCPGFSCCTAGALRHAASPHVESSQMRDQTCVPCVGRRILIYCTTREVPRSTISRPLFSFVMLLETYYMHPYMQLLFSLINLFFKVECKPHKCRDFVCFY